MAFISVAEELTKRSATSVENKFITKYLAELDPVAVKVYLYALFLSQSGQSELTVEDFSEKLNLDGDRTREYFEYLDEMELIAITSKIPFEIKILDCENYYGKPKKLHPEKYEGLYEEIQAIISGRMVSQNEFREYLILLEDYNFERNAVVMIVNYCVNLKGNDIGGAYIKKVAKNFAADGITSAKQIEEKLSSYTACTSSLLKLFSACSIKRKPEVEDGELLNKWLAHGFSEDAIICAAKGFKAKTMEKLDAVIDELNKNSKFDPKEIDDYRKEKTSLYETAIAVAKSLSVYMPDPTPYVENYVGVWCGYGLSCDALKKIANYCFLSGRNSFDLMNDFVENLYRDAFIDDDSVNNLLLQLAEDDKFIKSVHQSCGLTRKIIPYDRQALSRWRDWGFNEAMILKAAELSAGKNNPMAAVNYLLSTWKNGGIYTVEQIPSGSDNARKQTKRSVTEEWAETLAKLQGLNNNGDNR
ncbi:MAG: DnaD domain protein [Clostridiales bacterium]|nr:DnaD domain protein [Clostridiales bacterium]